jgi:glycosyltransferase involved in cell wall biosynthesis
MSDASVLDLFASSEAPHRRPRVSVVVPTYNEAKNLPHVFGLLPADVHQVIVVDGHSVDDTVAVARSLRPDVTVVRQNRRGKGNAMACGFAAVTGDIVVMLDADGSADPREIERYVDALVAGADFAKGSRFVEGGGSDDITRMRAWGNRWLNRIVNTLYGTSYTDLCYGYNAFWSYCLPSLSSRCRTVAGRASSGATGSRSRRSSTPVPPRPACASSRCRASSSPASTGRAT